MHRHVFAALLAAATLSWGQTSDPQVQKAVQDTVKSYAEIACEFEFEISSNVMDPKNSWYSKGTGYLAGPEKCYAKVRVTDAAGGITNVEWFENAGVAVARVGGGPWQKVEPTPRRDSATLFHWLSVVQVFKEVQGTSTYFPERSGVSDDGKKTDLALDLSPLLPEYYARFKLDTGANDPESPPQTSVTLTIDNEKKRFDSLGYTVVISQKGKAAGEADPDDWAWEDDDDRQGAMDHCGPDGPKAKLKGGEELINYSYQARFAFKYPTAPKKPQAPKDVTAILQW